MGTMDCISGIFDRPVHGPGLAGFLNQPAQPRMEQVKRFKTHRLDGFQRIHRRGCRSPEAHGVIACEVSTG
jgi:hypothetical protein